MKSSEMHSTESTEQDREILYALRKRDPNCVDISVGTLEHVIDRLDEADLDERLCAGLDIYYKATARRLIAQPQDAGELKAFEKHMAKQLGYRFHMQDSPRKRMYHARWDLLKELVADQRQVHQEIEDKTSYHALMRRRHVAQVLFAIVRSGQRGVYQKDLVRDMQLAKSTVSSITTQLQEARLIRKSGQGKENCLIPTMEGQGVARRIHAKLRRRRPAVAPKSSTLRVPADTSYVTASGD